jgi:hypothetical protein
MPKSFQDAFDEWKADKSYQIGDDIGWEFADDREAGPTPAARSSTPEKDGPTHSA